ncbi:hypothetical protein PILCRDRAFT_819906 [Piloderma croceum F 1598]|uniref:Uncharacterized protein n=1 Tax=Piloderma croceum (strain F 1598) TaxID=765440 RepID=A0A0C3C0Q1_PILCF|nr:hypothetical protein PILCRDRAFT_819906 [Piloderma croceum F 1598]
MVERVLPEALNGDDTPHGSTAEVCSSNCLPLKVISFVVFTVFVVSLSLSDMN